MLDLKIGEYQKQIKLLDGGRVALRMITPEDKSALLDFYSRLSEETRFRRYQYVKNQLTDSDLKDFCEVDYYNTMALVAEREQKDGTKEIVGVGRYCRLPDSGSAEAAFVVQDSEQGKGIGTQLVKYLAILAAQRHVRYFVAECLKMNTKMLSIFRKYDPGIKFLEGDITSYTLVISVPALVENVV